jgi:CRISPR-associated protein Cas4
MIPVSYLSAYLFCPRKLYLQKVLKKVEVPSKVILKGSIYHKAIELAGKSEELIAVKARLGMKKTDLLQMYEDRFIKLLNASILQERERLAQLSIPIGEILSGLEPAIRQEAQYRSNIVYNFMLSSKLSGRELWEGLIPRLKSEFRIESKDLGLYGRIDRLEDYGRSVIPVEIKTGKAPQGVWPGDRIQVAAYMMLLEQNGMNVQKGCILYSDGPREVIMNPFLIDNVLSLRDKVIRLLSKGVMPERLCSDSRCQACGLKEECYASL